MVDSAFNICDGWDFVMGDNRNDSYEAKYWDNKIVYGKMILEKHAGLPLAESLK